MRIKIDVVYSVIDIQANFSPDKSYPGVQIRYENRKSVLLRKENFKPTVSLIKNIFNFGFVCFFPVGFIPDFFVLFCFSAAKFT